MTVRREYRRISVGVVAATNEVVSAQPKPRPAGVPGIKNARQVRRFVQQVTCPAFMSAFGAKADMPNNEGTKVKR